jgi:NADH dehydrogenase FAD-containing subunit
MVQMLNYDKLIIATGSKSNKFGWPGQDLKVYKDCIICKILKRMETATQQGIKSVLSSSVVA